MRATLHPDIGARDADAITTAGGPPVPQLRARREFDFGDQVVQAAAGRQILDQRQLRMALQADADAWCDLALQCGGRAVLQKHATAVVAGWHINTKNVVHQCTVECHEAVLQRRKLCKVIRYLAGCHGKTDRLIRIYVSELSVAERRAAKSRRALDPQNAGRHRAGVRSVRVQPVCVQPGWGRHGQCGISTSGCGEICTLAKRRQAGVSPRLSVLVWQLQSLQCSQCVATHAAQPRRRRFQPCMGRHQFWQERWQWVRAGSRISRHVQ